MSLRIEDFEDFFREAWGHAPYPWQTRLAHEVCSVNRWPALLDLPTGSGKTATLDIALFHLALDGGRAAPRRIVFVVDRRIIVDQVGDRTLALRERLENAAPGSVTAKMADALRGIVRMGCHDEAEEPLLQTAILRGGTIRETDWARYPHSPLLAASTVDQVGSRLFFRGYGVSSGMSSVHAGLLGCDTLLLLDEVHLSRSFAETLTQLQGLRSRRRSESFDSRFAFVQLSATPGAVEGERFTLEEQDYADARLRRRLSASKPARLQLVKVKGKEEAKKRTDVANAAVKAATQLLAGGRRAIAVVVNRVDTARVAWELAYEGLREQAEVYLVTGRMRPLDQREVIGQVGPRVAADGRESTDGRPVVLIATQCIEAGADFDFDGLVTECASLDALRQRFGRLARQGPNELAEGVILARSDQVGTRGSKEPDPIYGTALAQAWTRLEEMEETLDFGILAMAPFIEQLGDRIDELLAPARETPVLMPAYLDQWVQTTPPPAADPEVALFLHGIPGHEREEIGDVQVVWRSDVPKEALKEKEPPRWLLDLLQAVPPGSLEALSIPVWAARAWLRDSAVGDGVADVEGVGEPSEVGRRTRGGILAHRALSYRGAKSEIVKEASDVKPGSVLVVPTAMGGIGRHGTWDPERQERNHVIRDWGDAVQLLQRGRPTLRFDARVISPWLDRDAAMVAEELKAEGEELSPRDRARENIAWIAAHSDRAPSWFRVTIELLTDRAQPVHIGGGTEPEYRLVSSRRRVSASALRYLLERAGEAAAASLATELKGEVTTIWEDGSFTSVDVSLERHLEGVGACARAMANACNLPQEVISAVRWAGSIHDIGKRDRRFQCMLHAGDPVATLAAERAGQLLAKSALPWQGREERRRARDAAGYLRGQRHELVSLDMAEGCAELEAAVRSDGADWDLVLHLVGSHHGWCRPFAPAIDLAPEDDEKVTWLHTVEGNGDIRLTGRTRHQRGRLGSGVSDRFWLLVRRYGWHELAWLEAFVRLADHRQSELEQIRGDTA